MLLVFSMMIASVLVQVELDIFSGRPNPSWSLSAEETQEFWKLFRTLNVSSQAASTREGLGYRGLIVREVEESNEKPHEILICDELVVARHVGKTRALVDKGRALERWLLKTAKGQIDETLYKEVMSELEGN